MERGSGVLLPVFSLPTRYGIGTFGKEARHFIKFLEASGQKYWQMLPLNPTSYGDSPYQSFSAFALNPYFIDLQMLIKQGFITKDDARPLNHLYKRDINYGELYQKRFTILHKAYKASYHYLENKIKTFRRSNAFWLNDYALFMVIKGLNGGKSWLEWSSDQRLRDKETLLDIADDNEDEIKFWIWCQYVAFTQYKKIKSFAKRHHIKIVGDIPIYVALDSSDVWANYKFFQLDEDRKPTLVAGVPPDYFSKTGQLWGNPLYDYEKMKATGFKWWKKRVSKCTKLFDVLRIDHFRGMESYWAVPYGDETAINGHWIKGPGMDLVNAIKQAAGKMEIIAEDLGFLTKEVIDLKKEANWPGLVVMEFGFDPNDTNFTSGYLPENYKSDCVAYLGTHDNDTLAHFFIDKKELLPTIQKYLHFDFANKKEKEFTPTPLTEKEIYDLSDEFISRMMKSKADVTIFLLQDFLHEGGEFRINTPGVASGNWHYRLPKDYLKNESLKEDMKKLTLSGQR